MDLPYTDSFARLFQIQQALDALRTSAWLEPGPSGPGAYPPVNVFGQGDEIVIIAEVPGVKKADLRLEVKGKTVRIAGTKSVGYGDKVSVHRRERLVGSFDRAVTVPVAIDADRVKAECHDGILALWLPLAERDRPKSISIT